MVRRTSLFGVALALTLIPAGLSAQNATITGTVRNQASVPVRGALLAIPELEVSTVSNDAGAFLLIIPADRARGQQARLSVSQIGYRAQDFTVTVSPGVQQMDITLREEAITLDAVVVTGTVGRQERRAQAAVVANIDAAEITQTAPVTSVANLLQARTPGVSLQQTSGTSGTAQTIRIRGASSISLSNEPLVFIDGVRADSRNSQFYGVGGQESSRLNDIRPEDIESIEVVKGPAAATLYGADASAGVIQIITKKGRAGGGFTQSVTMGYEALDVGHYEPPANWARCSATHVADPNRTLCYGQEVGTAVSDSPLERYEAFRTGQLRSYSWSGRGGGENYGFFVSLGADNEDGTLPSNFYDRYNGRFNFDFIPNPMLRLEAGLGMIRTETTLPQNDNNIYGYLGGGLLGSPVTVGLANDGWYAANRSVEAIQNIENTNSVTRVQPRVAANFTPFDWFTNRLTIGADMTRSDAWSFFPRNDQVWYGSADLNSGQISQSRQNSDRFTVDYLGNVTRRLTDGIDADISFGSQVIVTKTDRTYATGTRLATNTARSIDAASVRSGGQNSNETRSVGFFGQVQFSIGNRLFVQTAGRMDQNSAFGADSDPFFSPKVGFSYVLSDEAFWLESMPAFLNTFRIRAAYGTTGRSPTEGVFATYDPSPYAITSSNVGAGVIPQNPGNTDLKPERGTEIEAGFELGMFDERIGLEVTYFNKVTKDLILERPLPPSAAFSDDPFVNIGEVVNRGFEVAANANLVTRPDFGWSARVGFSTLHNEITDMGEVSPFGTLNRRMEGAQIGAFVTQRIRSINVADNHAVVSDTVEFWGNLLPTFEGSASTTMNILRNIQVYAQADWRTDFYIYNNTDQFRERQFGQGERWIRRDEILTDEERIRRFGPFVNESGAAVNPSAVNVAYIEPGDFLRLREVSLTYTFSPDIARYFRARGASITLAGRNLALWTKYTGVDPEINSSTGDFSRSEFLTTPTPRRWVGRINLQF